MIGLAALMASAMIRSGALAALGERGARRIAVAVGVVASTRSAWLVTHGFVPGPDAIAPGACAAGAAGRGSGRLVRAPAS